MLAEQSKNSPDGDAVAAPGPVARYRTLTTEHPGRVVPQLCCAHTTDPEPVRARVGRISPTRVDGSAGRGATLGESAGRAGRPSGQNLENRIVVRIALFMPANLLWQREIPRGVVVDVLCLHCNGLTFRLFAMAILSYSARIVRIASAYRIPAGKVAGCDSIPVRIA